MTVPNSCCALRIGLGIHRTIETCLVFVSCLPYVRLIASKTTSWNIDAELLIHRIFNLTINIVVVITKTKKHTIAISSCSAPGRSVCKFTLEKSTFWEKLKSNNRLSRCLVLLFHFRMIIWAEYQDDIAIVCNWMMSSLHTQCCCCSNSAYATKPIYICYLKAYLLQTSTMATENINSIPSQQQQQRRGTQKRKNMNITRDEKAKLFASEDRSIVALTWIWSISFNPWFDFCVISIYRVWGVNYEYHTQSKKCSLFQNTSSRLLFLS